MCFMFLKLEEKEHEVGELGEGRNIIKIYYMKNFQLKSISMLAKTKFQQIK